MTLVIRLIRVALFSDRSLSILIRFGIFEIIKYTKDIQMNGSQILENAKVFGIHLDHILLNRVSNFLLI